ncbi:hypothetical protein DOT_0345 [Desulfosporosinus sp. OT]|nr:hypothetical protein DOT_0345 [Desulfosporosinus sp. OT]
MTVFLVTIGNDQVMVFAESIMPELLAQQINLLPFKILR